MRSIGRHGLHAIGLGLAVMSMTTLGCSKPVGPQSGTVQFSNGQPVQSGSVELRHLQTGDRYTSRIDEKGHFEPRSRTGVRGVPEGKYEAVVVQIVMTEDLAADAHTHGVTVPRRYADYYTSNLRATVLPGQTDPIEVVIEPPEPEEP